jgi:putative DNA methylase
LGCGKDVVPSDTNRTGVACPTCRRTFDSHAGAAEGANTHCGACSARFAIARTARARSEPPQHRLYAKLLLHGRDQRVPARHTRRPGGPRGRTERLRNLAPPLPRVLIRDGYNTRQVLNYSYTRWNQCFNNRQRLEMVSTKA